MKYKISLFLLVALLVSCANSGTHPSKRIRESSTETFDITGEVLWQGERPIIYPIPTTAYKGACGKRHSDKPINVQKMRLWHLRLLDVAVWLEPLWEEMSPDDIRNLTLNQKTRFPEPIKINQQSCEFVPRFSVVPIGSTIEIYNDDRKDHWFVVEGKERKREQYVQYYGDVPIVFSFETPGLHHVRAGAPVVFTLNKSDKIHLVSGFHRWMDGWIFVTDKVWYSSVDDKGYFQIDDVPRGVYRVKSWNPILGENSSIIRVPDDTRSGTFSINYEEIPEDIEKILSTSVTTEGEIRDSHNVWQDIEDW